MIADVFFSIIITTYNRADLLATAIESVLNQSFSDFELLIIDDGSTDNTKELVGSIQKKDSRIKFHYQHNQERSVARNNGISYAQGEYICFLDSDDRYENNHLESLHEEINKVNKPIGMFVCNVSRMQEGKKEKVPFDSAENYKNNVEFILLSKESVIPARVCLHHLILKEYRFNPSINISEDAELFTRILSKYPLYLLKHYGVLYNLHEDNTTNLKNNPYLGQLDSLRIIFNNEELKKHISAKTRKQKLSSCYYGLSKYYHLKRKRYKMTMNLLRSISLNPTDKSTKHKVHLIFFNK